MSFRRSVSILFLLGLVSAILAVKPQDRESTITKHGAREETKQNRRERIVVAPPVQVSRQNASNAHFEVQVAADPTDRRRLMVCSMMLDNDRIDDEQTYRRPYPLNIVAYKSVDSGQTWDITYEFHDHQHHVDPACTFSPEGNAFVTSFGGDLYGLLVWNRLHRRDSKADKTIPAKAFLRMPLYRSIRAMNKWNNVVEMDVADREYVTVDDSPSKYRGRLYVHGFTSVPGIDGTATSGLIVSHSEDQGETYQSTTIADEGTQGVLGNSNGVVMSDGTFAFVFGDLINQRKAVVDESHMTAPNAKIKFMSSEDGGNSFGRATVVDDWYQRYNGSLNFIPSLAVDRATGVFQDRLYAAWVDVRAGRGQIRFSRSDDKGKTWLPSFVISDNSPKDSRGETPDAFMPVLAVNRSGVVGVMWYDRRDHPDNLGYDIRFSASFDGGESFLPSALVAAGGGSALEMKEIILREQLPVLLQSDGRAHLAFTWNYFDNGGDTAGLTSTDDGIFHPVWIDRRLGIQQISTTKIMVIGRGSANGGDGLETWHDQSKKAEVHYSVAHLDLATREIVVGAAILNTSKETIPAPIKLRLLRLASNSGGIEAENADNGITAEGAIWNFHAENELLQPGAFTVPRELRFRLANALFPPGPLRFSLGEGLLEVDTRILGR